MSQDAFVDVPQEFHDFIKSHPVHRIVSVPKVGRRGGSVILELEDMRVRVVYSGHSVSVDVALSEKSAWYGLHMLLFILKKADDPLKHISNTEQLAEWLTDCYEDIISFLNSPSLCEEYECMEQSRIRYLMNK